MDFNVDPLPTKWKFWTNPHPDINRTKAQLIPNYKSSNAIISAPNSPRPILHKVRISFCTRQLSVPLIMIMMTMTMMAINNLHSTSVTNTDSVLC
jgi:hypothetical protein